MTEQNISQQFAQLGLDVIESELIYDKITPCRLEDDKGNKKKGWYILFRLRLDNGEEVTTGAFGNWKTGAKSNVELNLKTLSDDERKAFREQQDKARQARELEQRALNREAAQRARTIWPKLPEVGSSDYLKRKRVGGYGVRFTRGSIAVPVCKFPIGENPSAPSLIGLQFIQADGFKKFLTGTAKQGSWHLVGELAAFASGDSLGSPIFVAEGYATAATVHMATGRPCFVAFDAGNLKPVCDEIRRVYPAFSIVICSDDDHLTPGNPGQAKAADACGEHDRVIKPLFPGDRDDGDTDYNDLHCQHGLAFVRDQILEALDTQPGAHDLPPPSEDQARFTLEKVLERFAVTMPDGRVWDTHQREIIRPAQFRLIVGKSLADKWFNDDSKKKVRTEEVAPAAVDKLAEGDGDFAKALRRYTYIYPTDTAFDHDKREIVPINALRLAIAATYDQWLKSDRRRDIDVERIVFDPCNQFDPDTHINTFRGLPLTPERNDDACNGIRMVIHSLVNYDDAAFDWVLKWLAYPLQNVGAKMATAILMHSETEGTGKSLLFDGYIRQIYGEEYSGTLGQHQLESQYTDWKHKMLFCNFEEVLSRGSKYSHQGSLKHMITGATHRIEKKFVSGWEEANHMNAVFLSNEIQPFPVDPTDRRFMVIWPLKTIDPDVLQVAVDQLTPEGIKAFYAFLLEYDVGDFHEHTKPLMTDAKQQLIDFGRSGWEVFHGEWSSGALEVPYAPCLTRQLYLVYKRWSAENGERAMSKNKFTGFLRKRERFRQDLHYEATVGKNRKGSFFFADGEQPQDQTQGVWLGRCVSEFDRHLINYEDKPQ